MKTGTIYIIKNDINNCVYIGQTTRKIEQRFKDHLKRSTLQLESYKLHKAVRQFGREHFYVEALEEHVPVEELDQKEIEYIAQYDAFQNGYNGTPGGDGRIINICNHEQDVIEMADTGVGAKEIANLFGVHKATIMRTLHKCGFYYRPSPAKILELAADGIPIKQIAQQLQCDPHTVTRWLHKNGIRKHRQRMDQRTDFDIDLFRQDYYAQMPIEQLCLKYNLSKTTFYRIKKQIHMDTRNNKKGVTTMEQSSRPEDELPVEAH